MFYKALFLFQNLKEELKNYLEAKETGTNSKPKGIGVANVAISPADTVENRSTDLNCIERMETCDTVEKDKDADEVSSQNSRFEIQIIYTPYILSLKILTKKHNLKEWSCLSRPH